MKKILSAMAAGLAVSVLLASDPQEAIAGDRHGDFMIRGVVTGVLPDADASVKVNGTPFRGASADVSDEVIPATTLTYFFNDHWAVELFCCFAKHEVDGAGALNGVKLGDTWIFPPALTAQYHFNPDGTFKPYVGAGVQYIHFFDESNKLPLATNFSLDDGFGFTLQGGLDIAVGEGWYINADVKKTWLGMDARWGGRGTSITADVDLDPLIVSAGFGYRFNLSDLLGGHGTTAAYEELK
jgi:outer membrane protein